MNTELELKMKHHARDTVWAVEENNQTETPKAGFAVIVVETRSMPGSFKGGDLNAHLDVIFSKVEGSVMDRLCMIDQILQDIPAAYYPLVRENIATNYKNRVEWELINEENGVSVIPEETVESVIPAMEDGGIVSKLKTVIYTNLSRKPKE